MSDNSDNQFPFERLPLKIFTIICSYLSHVDLKCLTKTSKTINDLIKHDPETMKKLPLQLNKENIKKMQEAKRVLTRTYTSVEVGSEKFDKIAALWLTSNYCSKVRVLKFSTMKFQAIDSKLLRKAFQALQDLEILHMEECEVLNYSPSLIANIEPIVMKNLKDIYFRSTHLSFLQFFNPPNLRKLKITNVEHMDSPISIVSFIAKYTHKLTHLALYNLNFQHSDDIKEGEIESIQAPLKNFSIAYLQNPFNGNLLKFMEKFVDTLEELDVEKFKEKLPDEFYAFVLKRMKNIKLLGLQLSDAPNSKEFYENLEVNTNIKYLMINDEAIGKKIKFNGLLSKLPNLDRLSLYKASIGKTSLETISTQCKSLKKLEFHQVDYIEMAIGEAHMPNLMDLSICNISIGSQKGWESLVKAFPNLEKFSLHVVCHSALTDKAFNILTTGLAKIKHFVLGKGFKATKKKCNFMLANCDSLRTVEVATQSFQSHPELLGEVQKDFNDKEIRLICYTQPEFCKILDCDGIPSFWLINEHEEEEVVEIDILQAMFIFFHGNLHRRRNDPNQQQQARADEVNEEPRGDQPPEAEQVFMHDDLD